MSLYFDNDQVLFYYGSNKILLKGCGKNHPPCPEDYACQFPNGTIIEDYKPTENDTDLDGKCVPKGNSINKYAGRYHDPFNAPN